MTSQMEDLGFSLIQEIMLMVMDLLTQEDQEMDLLTQETDQVMDLLTQADQEMDLLTQEMDQETDLLTQEMDQEDPMISLNHITPFITICHNHRKKTQTRILK